MGVKKFSNGGFVQNEKSNNLKVVHCGCRLVSRSQYEKYGAELLRKINGTPSAELIVVDDERLAKMTLAKKMRLLCR